MHASKVSRAAVALGVVLVLGGASGHAPRPAGSDPIESPPKTPAVRAGEQGRSRETEVRAKGLRAWIARSEERARTKRFEAELLRLEIEVLDKDLEIARRALRRIEAKDAPAPSGATAARVATPTI